MKKRSEREKNLLLHRSKKKMNRPSRMKSPTTNETQSAVFKKVNVGIGNDKRIGYGIPISPPSNFSLEHNADQVTKFMKELRHNLYLDPTPNRPKSIPKGAVWLGRYADFTAIETISTAAALVLAAEFYRLKEKGSSRKQLVLVDLNQWNSEVKKTLHQLGFLKILDINIQPPELKAPDRVGNQVQEFISGTDLPPDEINTLASALFDLITNWKAPLRIKIKIYTGLSEAMTNTKDHAYPNQVEPGPLPLLKGQWWMTGSVSECRTKLDIVFFDQGVSIPQSISQKNWWQKVKKFLHKPNDGVIIQKAVEYGKSSTKEQHRGKGLPQMVGLIDNVDSGKMRILSRQGEYIYNSSESVKTRALLEDIGGTLIHWCFSSTDEPAQ